MTKTLTADEQQALNRELYAAAERSEVATIGQVLITGAEIDARTTHLQDTALHRAALNCKSDVVKALLEAGAELDLPNIKQKTSLHLAAINKWARINSDNEAARVLIAAGASLDSKNEDGKTPIDDARERGHTDFADYMQSIADDPRKRPTPQDVGLDMKKRNASLMALGKKPVIGPHTLAMMDGGERQRLAALNDPEQGI